MCVCGHYGAWAKWRLEMLATNLFRACALGPRFLRGARFTSKRVIVDLSRPSRSAISFGDSSSWTYHCFANRISSADMVDPGIEGKAEEG